MKTMKKIIIAVLAIVALSVMSAVTQTGTANASSMMIEKPITDADVIAYLVQQGFSSSTIIEVFADGTRRCTSELVGYSIYVYLNADQTAIVGWEEVPY